MIASPPAQEQEVQEIRVLGQSFQINLDKILLTGSARNNQIKPKVAEALASGHRSFIMDFSNAVYIDSYRLGIIYVVVREIQRAGGKVFVERMSEDIREIFISTKLSVIFDRF